MNIVKNIREQHGLTQVELAAKTGLSLRTIQRLESSNKEPKGYTLTVIAEAFSMKPSALQKTFKNRERVKKSETTSIRLINLAVLSCIGIPFGNIIVPFILWRKNRTSKFVDDIGKRIINFQIIWSVVLSLLLVLSPFIGQQFFSNVPIILFVLLAAYIFNIVIVCYTAIKLQQNNFDFLHLPIRFI